MRLAAIAFTGAGLALGNRLAEGLRAQGDAVRVARGFGPDKPPLAAWTREAFAAQEGLVFIGAAGIAVRAIAPCLGGKRSDPAVVVLDEGGRFAISLLSGHAGGANRLARRIAALVGAQPVITTATDGRGVFAADVWALAHGITLLPPEAVKAVSAALLEGRPVGLVSDFPVDGPLPEGFTPASGTEIGLYAGLDIRKQPFARTLTAVPRVLALGIGCRRGVPAAALSEQVDLALLKAGGLRAAVCAVHSIDLKAQEPGLVALCRANGWPLRTFSAPALRALPGAFTASKWVEAVTGVDNVCERAAVAAGGRLLLEKQSGQGVAVAVAALPYALCFMEVEEC